MSRPPAQGTAARLSGRSALGVGGRLWAGSALCLLPFGMSWTVEAGTFLPGGILHGGPCNDAGYCPPDVPLPGVLVPGATVEVSQAPIRVFLLIGAGLLALVAVRTRTAVTRRVARLGTASIGIAAVLAAGNGSSRVLLCLLAALTAAGPLAWRSRTAPPVFGSTTFRR